MFLPERREAPKTKVKQLRKIKTKLAHSNQMEGETKYDLNKIKQKLEQGVLSIQEAILIYKELTK